MELQQYIDYILEARKRGFRDDVIKQSLIEKNWPESEIIKAFYRIDGEADRTKEMDEEVKKPKAVKPVKKPVKIDTKEAMKKAIQEHQEINKELQEQALDAEINLKESSSIMIFLDEELRDALEKRAKKNMFTLSEQIEDILRRSTLNQKLKRSPPEEKLDDKLVGLFSRKNTGPKAKKKTKKKSNKNNKKTSNKKKTSKKKSEKKKAKKK